jgi:hypothetical protein
MAITRIGNPAIADQKGVNFRNIIINGDMSIAQRGTSKTGLGNGDAGYHTCDRWNFGESGSPSAEFTQTQSTDVPTGQGFATSLKMDCTTADASTGASSLIFIGQKIEGQNLQYLKKGTSSAESLTLSFWVKSNKTGTYIVNLYDNDNTRNISKSYTISSASTWEKKTIIYAGDTTGAFGNDNGESAVLYFNLLAGSNFTSGTLQTSWGAYSAADYAVGQVNLADSTSNEWYITGVQLEAGQVASDFEFLPFDVNLERCIRYYTVSQEAAQWGGFAAEDRNAVFGDRLSNYSNVPVNHRFPKRMRTVPTVTTYSLIGTSGACSDTGTSAGNHSADDPCNTGRVSESGIGYLTSVTNDGGDGLAFQYEADAEL